jgi:hypothetical protein
MSGLLAEGNGVATASSVLGAFSSETVGVWAVPAFGFASSGCCAASDIFGFWSEPVCSASGWSGSVVVSSPELAGEDAPASGVSPFAAFGSFSSSAIAGMNRSTVKSAIAADRNTLYIVKGRFASEQLPPANQPLKISIVAIKIA